MPNLTDDRSNDLKFQELIEVTREAMERFHVPGASIGLFVDGEEYTAGLGVTSIENPLPVTPETLFQIGSTTKTITSTAIFQLIEQGKLSLDDLVRKHLPNFKVKDEDTASRVTIRQLLNHTSGWMGDYFLDTGAGEDALAKYVDTMADLAQLTPLGAIYTYNNAAFNVAGRVIEVLTGKTYEAAIRELVLEPLEMTNSFFFAGEVMVHRFTVGHILKDDQPVIATPWDMSRAEAPCGGLVSDLHDQLRYARFHMGDGTNPKGVRLINPESLKLMQTPGVKAGDEGWIGMNWFIRDIDGVRFVSHGGSTNGLQSTFWMVPEKGLALTTFANTDRGGLLNEEIEKWVWEHFLGVVETDPTPVDFSEEELQGYVSQYVMAPTGDLFDFQVSPGGLLMKHTVGDYSSISDITPDPIPPLLWAPFAPDQFIVIEGKHKGFKSEFLREKDGSISWWRFGGRVMARQTPIG